MSDGGDKKKRKEEKDVLILTRRRGDVCTWKYRESFKVAGGRLPLGRLTSRHLRTNDTGW